VVPCLYTLPLESKKRYGQPFGVGTYCSDAYSWLAACSLGVLRGRKKRSLEHKEKETLTAEVLDKFAQLITTALGLVAALAWNDAIQNLFNQYLGSAGAELLSKFLYAGLVTLIVIFATIAVSRAADRAKKLEEERNKGLLGLGRSKE
jgi:hypothetical protein